MLDQALIGSVVTGALALLSQGVSKLKCYIACKRTDEGEVCQPEFACGFLDGNLLPQNVDSDKDDSKSA